MSALSITQAAKLMGKSQATLRAMGSSKIIPAEKSNNGSWLFIEDEILKHMSANSQSMFDSKVIRRSPNLNSDQVISAYERQFEILEKTIERERRINDEMRDQLKQFQSEILKLTHEIRSILSNENKPTLSRWIKSTAKDVFSKNTSDSDLKL